MNHRHFSALIAAVQLASIAMSPAWASPQTTAFTYQGQLNAGGTFPSGQTYQFTFTLYDAATNGNVVGHAIQQSILVGSGGIFTTDLDFGQIFNGQQYWLEIDVGNTVGSEQPLSARQPISAVPVAQYAMAGVTGATGPVGPAGPVGATGPSGPMVANVGLTSGPATGPGYEQVGPIVTITITATQNVFVSGSVSLGSTLAGGRRT